MKFRKAISLLLALALILGALAACGGNNGNSDSGTPDAGDTGSTFTPPAAPSTPAATPPPPPDDPEWYDAYGLDENLRFLETRHITVEVYNRNNDGGSDPTNNAYTRWIHDQVLAKHNIDVTFKDVVRFPEDQTINNMLAAGDAPDVCVTYSGSTIQNYASMGAVHDLEPYFTNPDSGVLFPNIWDFLGGLNIFWSQDPSTGELWQLEGRRIETVKVNTFVREDWLATLNISKPTTLEQFEEMLYAFRDNADTLLGADANQMIPLVMEYDAGWAIMSLIESFIPENITDKDLFVYGYDSRHLTRPSTKEAVRVANKWYNENLVWKDFALYSAGDSEVRDNLLKSGYIGAIVCNWDLPYRNGEDSWDFNLKSLVSPDAGFIPVDCFKNDGGFYRKYMYNPSGTDRKVFLPYTNDEPLASLLYVDWICDFENLHYLQFGDAGVTHEVMPDGAFKLIGSTGETIMNSPNNIDMTLLCNGIFFPDSEQIARSLAVGYANIDPRYIIDSRSTAMNDGRLTKNAHLGAIESEAEVGAVLDDKRNVVFCTAIVATPDNFDSVYDAALADYMATGAQAGIDERMAKWEAMYGTGTMLPETP